MAAPRTPQRKLNEKGHDVCHVLYRPWYRFCVMGRGPERRHLTQSGGRDDRPRVFADNRDLSGDSAPLSVGKGQTHWHDVHCSRFDESSWRPVRCTFACEMDRWIGRARKSLSEQMESAVSVSLSFVFSNSCRRNDHCGRDESSLMTLQAVGLLRESSRLSEAW